MLPDSQARLSSQPSLSRFENSVDESTISRMNDWFENEYVRSLPKNTKRVVLDIDTTDDLTHGQQELSAYNGYYGHDIYHPMLVFDGGSRLASFLLRPGDAGPHKGADQIIERLVRKLKVRFPRATILVRADAAFSTPKMLEMLDSLAVELGDVKYYIGIPCNSRIAGVVANVADDVKTRSEQRRKPVRRFMEFQYEAHTWSRSRTIVAKLEHMVTRSNHRFVVTNLDARCPRDIYVRGYCPRGDSENRIKDLKLALAADRLSDCKFVANGFRLFLHAVAYRLMQELRSAMCPTPEFVARPQFDTLRIRILKVAAQIEQSTRRIVIHLPKEYSLTDLFARLACRIGASQKPKTFVLQTAA